MNEYKTPKHAELRALFDHVFEGKRYRDYREQIAHNNTRMYRALSWLGRSEDCNPKNDAVERFLFLWLSFNAAYGNDAYFRFERSSKELGKIEKFLKLAAKNDRHCHLADITRIHKDAFHKIIEIRFLFQPFWQAAYSEQAWLAWWKHSKPNPSRPFPFNDFSTKNNEVQIALQITQPSEKKTTLVLPPTFARIYMLRNQVFHGAATCHSHFNRSSLDLANTILGACVPEILKIMLETMETQKHRNDWNQVEYPPFLRKPDDDEDTNPPQIY